MKKCSYCLKMVVDYAAFCSRCGRPFPKETIIGLESDEEQELEENEDYLAQQDVDDEVLLEQEEDAFEIDASEMIQCHYEEESNNIMPPPFENLAEGEIEDDEEMPPPIPDDLEEDYSIEMDEELPPPLPDEIFEDDNVGIVLPPPYLGEENVNIVPPPFMGD